MYFTLHNQYWTWREFQGHHTNQAYCKLGIMSLEYRHSGGSGGCTMAWVLAGKPQIWIKPGEALWSKASPLS